MDENIVKYIKHIKIKKENNKLPVKIVDAISGGCICGYMAKYPICTKCGRSYPNNIINKKY